MRLSMDFPPRSALTKRLAYAYVSQKGDQSTTLRSLLLRCSWCLVMPELDHPRVAIADLLIVHSDEAKSSLRLR